MQDPSNGVPQFLLPHVHLISSFRYPAQQKIQPDLLLDYLLQAPKVVKEVQPVAWTYLQNPPPDGTVLLVWQPQQQRQSRFSSDGYVWADPEATFHYELRGYNVEVLVHRSGYRPGLDAIACHSRHRYRIIGKDLNAPGPSSFDPSLWIVHYATAEDQYHFPANQIRINQEIQRVMQERYFVESQGQLLRKEFMLYDRNNWPTISLTQNPPRPALHAQPGATYANSLQQMAGMNRQAQYYQQGQGGVIGPSPAKRPRQIPPAQLPGTNAPGMQSAVADIQHDTSIEDEENTTLGDLLDHLTPREISTVRYTQHHEWMEEIFSSPYAAGRIMPVDLGLGLSGQLVNLTEGLFDAPGAQAIKDLSRPSASLPAYTKMQPARVEEFERRIAGYINSGKTEIEKMKSDHARKIAEMKRTKTYVQAERKLRDITWEDAGVSRHMDGEDRGKRSRTTVEDIVREVEIAMNVSITPRQEVICVQKGGLVEETFEQANGAVDRDSTIVLYPENSLSDGLLGDNALGGDDTTSRLLDQYGNTSFATTPAANMSTPQTSQPVSQSHSAVATPGATSSDRAQNNSYQDQLAVQPPAVTQDDDPMSLMEGMDLDLDISGLRDSGVEKDGESDWIMVDQSVDGVARTNGSVQLQSSTVANQDSTAGASHSSADGATDSAAAAAHQSTMDTPGIFDTAEFGDFGNLDTAGDALADYAGGADDLGLDLDNSAFGDAFHGTEAHQGENEEGAGGA